MVNVSEVVINSVTYDLPKMLTGSNQNGKGVVLRFGTSQAETKSPRKIATT
jgi:hypothetical protein